MSRLAPEPDELPTKIVLHGAEPGSAESVLLSKQLGGEIRHLLSSARQARLLAESPSQFMTKAMPNGRGRLIYNFNQGIETLHVHLEPTFAKELAVEGKRDQPGRADPVLAIDVLFTNEMFTAYDITTLTSETTTPGGNYPAVPEVWDVQVLRTLESVRTLYPAGAIEELTSERVDFFQQLGAAYNPDHIRPGPNFKFDTNGPVEFYHVYAVMKFVDDGFHDYGWGIGGTGVMLIEVGDRQPGTPGGTYPPVVTRFYGREARDYFDVLIPAGAVGDPEPEQGDESYEAVALGRTGRYEDGRLIPASELQVSKACTRAFTAVAPPVPPVTEGGGNDLPQGAEIDAPSFWAGQGFIARPKKTQIIGVPIEKTVIDIYVGSSNNTQLNDFPGTSPRFDFVKTSLKGPIKVQLREFAAAPPVGIRVDLETDMVQRTYTSPQANQGPTRQLTSTDGPSTPPRPGTWHFAAAPNWVDGGNEPAEPDRKDADGKEMMGKLLDQKTFDEETLTANQIEPVPSALLHEPIWPGDVGGRMRFLCRIEWTPPEEVYLTGTAKIL